jgi:hypothetical protein
MFNNTDDQIAELERRKQELLEGTTSDVAATQKSVEEIQAQIDALKEKDSFKGISQVRG